MTLYVSSTWEKPIIAQHVLVYNRIGDLKQEIILLKPVQPMGWQLKYIYKKVIFSVQLWIKKQYTDIIAEAHPA